MQKITAIFFSPTGNSKKYVLEMAKAGLVPTEVVDVTAMEPRERTFGKEDLVIFGAPVHGGLIPEAAAARFKKFKGEGTPCVLVASYGNRHYDDALVQMADIASDSGFTPQGAAAVIGRHTFGEVQVDRPNAEDLQQAADFFKKLIENIDEAKKLDVPGRRPYESKGVKGKFRPQTKEDCGECGLCVRNCPVGAIAMDCVTISDDCISCFRCIRSCPTQQKYIDTEMYKQFAAAITQRLAQRRENEFYL